MPEPRIVDSIDAVDPRRWDALFPHQIERHAYLRAVERSGLEGFSWRYLLVEERGEIVAAAPAFLVDYPLETTLTGPGHRVASKLRRLFPRLLTPRLACLGSPCTEMATIGFAAGGGAERRRQLTGALLDGLEQLRRREGADLAALKDVGEPDRLLLTSLLRARGFGEGAGLPVARLELGFASIDDYLARLSPGTRRDMRRKLRSREALRIETVRDVAPVIDRVMALYRQTRDRADMKFEELTPAYFRGVLAEMGERAFMTLYWSGDDLLAANLLLQDGDTLLDKFFCMDAERGRPLNLYFVSWFANVAHCLEQGLRRYQPGQAAYANKLRLGATLVPTRMCFRHRNPLFNRLLQAATPFLEADEPQGHVA